MTEIKYNVAILAGGLGTRLSSVSKGVPKVMMPLFGIPMLEYSVRLCERFGFTNILLLLGHGSTFIRDFFISHGSSGVTIGYLVDENPSGTWPSIDRALPHLDQNFLLMYGDVFAEVDLSRFFQSHTSMCADVTMVLHPNSHPYDSDLVELTSTKRVKRIHGYPHKDTLVCRNLVNAGLLAIRRCAIEDFKPPIGKSDLTKDLIPQLLSNGRKVYGYITPEYIKDMGTPERLKKLEEDITRGIPILRSSQVLRQAVFLDRDGTIIEEKHLLDSVEKVVLVQHAGSAIRRINESGALAVVLTNQSVVARGNVSLKGLSRIHSRMDKLLGSEGAFLDGLYFCPHHPERGFAGEVGKYKVDCPCRKPKTGLVDQACSDLSIDRGKSWLIGDTTTDILTALNAGIKSILVKTGYGGSDHRYSVKPNFVFPNLYEAVDWILSGYNRTRRKMLAVYCRIPVSTKIVLISGNAASGKSTVAQVLSDILSDFGVSNHILSMDSWLKAGRDNMLGSGIESRYDLHSAERELENIYFSTNRISWRENFRLSRGVDNNLSRVHSIGPKDVVIVEGVPVLLMSRINSLKNVFRIHIRLGENKRVERLRLDYLRQGFSDSQFEHLFASRSVDETQKINSKEGLADIVIDGDDG